MANLKIKPSGSCAFDMVALGEIMLRLDPGEGIWKCGSRNACVMFPEILR